jgi:hypothetical protein
MWSNPHQWSCASRILTKASALALIGALALGGCGTTASDGHLDSLEVQKTHPKMWARANTTVDEMRADFNACVQGAKTVPGSIPELLVRVAFVDHAPLNPRQSVA